MSKRSEAILSECPESDPGYGTGATKHVGALGCSGDRSTSGSVHCPGDVGAGTITPRPRVDQLVAMLTMSPTTGTVSPAITQV